MGNRRVQLQTLLEEILGSRNVYFQPPETVKMNYPCIVYSRGYIERTLYADDIPYQHKVRYDVLVIDKNPDSEILDKIASLPMCIFQRSYTKDNLNHDLYNLYY
jgi:hypothetical protein